MYRTVLTAALLTVLGCAAPTAPAPDDTGFDPAPFDRPTTSAKIAQRNLDATIAGQERALIARPADPALLVSLSDALLTRSQFRGTFADLDRVKQLGAEAVAQHPEAGWALELRANAHQAVHAFDAAEADLRAATVLDGKDRTLAATTIWLARGERLHEVLALRRAAAERHPTFRNRTAVAAALGALGRYPEADAEWVAALDAYRDVSPLPVAYVAFQRGVMWSEQADRPDRGLRLYREAVQRFPAYGVANVHLAELEWQAGDATGAAQRLERIRELTQDPEPTGLLSEIVAADSPTRAAALSSQARDGYEGLFARHPLAFLDHGAEFFSGPGADPGRALRLAERNLENRANARAYEIALNAAEAAGDRDAFCDIARRAASATPTVGLRQRLDDAACR